MNMNLYDSDYEAVSSQEVENGDSNERGLRKYSFMERKVDCLLKEMDDNSLLGETADWRLYDLIGGKW